MYILALGFRMALALPKKGVLLQKLQAQSVSRPAKSKSKLFPCPHCGKYLVKKTFNKHRRLFYDDLSDRWRKTNLSVGEYIPVKNDTVYFMNGKDWACTWLVLLPRVSDFGPLCAFYDVHDCMPRLISVIQSFTGDIPSH